MSQRAYKSSSISFWSVTLVLAFSSLLFLVWVMKPFQFSFNNLPGMASSTRAAKLNMLTSCNEGSSFGQGTRGGLSINASIFHYACSDLVADCQVQLLSSSIHNDFDFGFWVSSSPDSPMILWLNKSHSDQHRSQVWACVRELSFTLQDKTLVNDFHLCLWSPPWPPGNRCSDTERSHFCGIKAGFLFCKWSPT